MKTELNNFYFNYLLQSLYENCYPKVCMTDILREGITLRVFENMFMRTFGYKGGRANRGLEKTA